MPAKLIMILTLLVALLASWFVVRWYLGNTIAEYQPAGAGLESSQMAVSLAPQDPVSHLRLGSFIQTQLPPDQIPAAVAEYEKAVSLSPNDYRCWMALGSALEQAGDFDNAEEALRQGVKLAPSYAYTRWSLGNLLLRTDRYPEAFAELRLASEADKELQPQLFNLDWQLNKNDYEALKAAVGNTPDVRAEFSTYVVARGVYDEGLRLWNSLNETEKRDHRAAADLIINSLIRGNQFHRAVEVWNDVAPGPAYRAEIGHIIDRGFEDNVAHGKGAVFGWEVQPAPQVQLGIAPNMGHTGSRSLRLSFQVRQNLSGMDISQLVPVRPNTQYDFECYVKTERLESASTPVVAITGANSYSVLASSEAAPSGSNNWQRIPLSFKTDAVTEAVTIRIVRGPCVDSPVCPIFGTVWYDDFDLKPRK
ncbi:MAG: tetratricopeptide repeat protein [Acidobacteriota bacterium]|nr:tetratricopeptide repeat protein [Acidobacteriota bacterium]